jgi:hypothetical protein
MQNRVPPQSLQAYLSRLCTHSAIPPQSRHRAFFLPCSQNASFNFFGCFAPGSSFLLETAEIVFVAEINKSSASIPVSTDFAAIGIGLTGVARPEMGKVGIGFIMVGGGADTEVISAGVSGTNDDIVG